MTWNNAPAADTTLVASLGSVSTNTWYEVDLTSLVTGDGTYSLRVSDCGAAQNITIHRKFTVYSYAYKA